MKNRLQYLDKDQIEKIHRASMRILAGNGIVFKDNEAIEIFKSHGFKVEGKTVYISEEQVQNALTTVPQEFTIMARNSEKSVRIGGDNFAFGPGWAAPYIIDTDGKRRNGKMEDFMNFCKLVHTSETLDFAAGSMVIPAELAPVTAATEMLVNGFLHSDKPLVANPCSRENGLEMAKLARIVWGREAKDLGNPISIVSVNPLSPLSYADDTIGGLIEFARQGQALLVSSMVLAGISGPINVAGTAVMEITESLAGIVLAQLVNPGTPCVCGGTSCAADMRTGGVNLGGPEFLQLMAISSQMADYYGIPCRYGGGLTDSYSVNIQAGIESSLAIGASLFSGIHFMHQACGILGAYSAISFEKFVIDEAVCAMARCAVQPLDISDEGLGLEVIERVGSGGNFLMQPETARQCRTAFFSSPLFVRGTYDAWESNNLGNVVERAAKHVEERIGEYVKPDIDPSVERDLRAYASYDMAI